MLSAPGPGCEGRTFILLFPLVREPRCHTRHDSIVRLCMFGLFRHVGKSEQGEQKEVCVITASRACDLQSGTINHPIIVPPLTVTLPNVARVASSLQLHVPTRNVRFPVRKGIGSWGGGELARPITTATASAGGSGDHHKVWSLLPLCCSRHRWPKTKARLCETSLLRALAGWEPHRTFGLPPREEEPG